MVQKWSQDPKNCEALFSQITNYVMHMLNLVPEDSGVYIGHVRKHVAVARRNYQGLVGDGKGEKQGNHCM